MKTPELLGYVHARLCPKSTFDKKTKTLTYKFHGHITGVYVLTSRRRCGLATKLLNLAQDKLEKLHDADYITVDVPKPNYEAKHLFEHTLGYTLDDEDEDAYHFVKRLKGNDIDSSTSGETQGNGVDSSSGKTKRNRSNDGSCSRETKRSAKDT